jgi:hypothetical protein
MTYAVFNAVLCSIVCNKDTEKLRNATTSRPHFFTTPPQNQKERVRAKQVLEIDWYIKKFASFASLTDRVIPTKLTQR